MKKSILNLVGVQVLTSNEQKNIAGGKSSNPPPPPGLCQCYLSTTSPSICYTGGAIPPGATLMCYW